MGWLEPEEVRDVLLGSDVLIHPSLHDAYPAAVLEAMAVGLPQPRPRLLPSGTAASSSSPYPRTRPSVGALSLGVAQQEMGAPAPFFAPWLGPGIGAAAAACGLRHYGIGGANRIADFVF